MDSPFFVRITDARAVIADSNGDLWLPLDESADLSSLTEVVEVAGAYFDAVGYSEPRDALLLEPLVVEGSAENLEAELAEYIGGE